LWAAFLQPVKAQISMSAHLHPQDMEGIDDPNANQGGADENAAANAAAAAATAAAAAAAAAQAQALADAEAAAAAVEAQALAAARNKGPANTGPAPWAREVQAPRGLGRVIYNQGGQFPNLQGVNVNSGSGPSGGAGGSGLNNTQRDLPDPRGLGAEEPQQTALTQAEKQQIALANYMQYMNQSANPPPLTGTADGRLGMGCITQGRGWNFPNQSNQPR
jgi:opacity protein-like surface antigen